MNNDNRKIIKYDPNTGAPIYEDVPTQVQQEPVVDNNRFQLQQNNSFEQPVVNQMNNQNNFGQPMMNQYQQQPMAPQMPMQQPKYQQPQYNYQPQNNYNQMNIQPNNDNKKSNKGLIIGIIVGVVVLVAVVLIGFFVFFNGKDDKKTDDKPTAPETTINDYDDPTPTPDPEPEKPTTSSDYISFGHLKYKKYSGYNYSLGNDVLNISYGKNGKISIFETTATDVMSHSSTDEDYINYLVEDLGFESADDLYLFEQDDYKYIVSFVEYQGATYLYFCSSTPNSSYYVEGLMSDPDASDINDVLDTLENVLSNIEK